jgi:hypothetical protein
MIERWVSPRSDRRRFVKQWTYQADLVAGHPVLSNELVARGDVAANVPSCGLDGRREQSVFRRGSSLCERAEPHEIEALSKRCGDGTQDGRRAVAANARPIGACLSVVSLVSASRPQRPYW